ncbi:aldo/keto reductase [Candidatus Woesearchaeota archaeon]|nr:aldo/keto reductase [Candidatus Woesearchaeota archaeon]
MAVSPMIGLNDGHGIPVLGLGTWQMSSKAAEAAVGWALEAGYRHVDTAAIYGNEEGVGRALRSGKVAREEVFVATKLWNADHKSPRDALLASLRRLQLDYVDLYLIHFPVPQRVRSWKALEALQAEGLCRSIGVSNFTVRHLEGLFGDCSVVPAVNQVELHPFLYQRGLLELCRKKGVVVEAYSPLTHGQRLDDARLAEVASRCGKSPAQVLIRWCVQKGMVVLPKSANKERIAENADVFGFRINEGDMAFLDSLDEGFRTCWNPTDAP